MAVNTDYPSRFDLLTGDTKGSDLLDTIITNSCPQSWFYFLEHILTFRKTATHPTPPAQPPPSSTSASNTTSAYNYSFETFDKFFAIFKSTLGTKNNFDRYRKTDMFYIRVWLLHAQSHILDYERNVAPSQSRQRKKNKIKIISQIYQTLFRYHIGTNFAIFYVEWAKYYLARRLVDKARKKLKLGLRMVHEDARETQQLNELFAHLQQQQPQSASASSMSDGELSVSSESESEFGPFSDDDDDDGDGDGEDSENDNKQRIHARARSESMDIDHEQNTKTHSAENMDSKPHPKINETQLQASMSKSRSFGHFGLNALPQRLVHDDAAAANGHAHGHGHGHAVGNMHDNGVPPTLESDVDAFDDEDEEDDDDDDDAVLSALQFESERHVLAPISEHNKIVISSPFAPPHPQPKNALISTQRRRPSVLAHNSHSHHNHTQHSNHTNLSVMVPHKKLTPFTPNTLMRNMASTQQQTGKRYTFSNRDRRSHPQPTNIQSPAHVSSTADDHKIADENSKENGHENAGPKSPMSTLSSENESVDHKSHSYSYSQQSRKLSKTKSPSDDLLAHKKQQQQQKPPPQVQHVEHVEHVRHPAPPPPQNGGKQNTVIRLKGQCMLELRRIGRGGSSEVFQVITRDTHEILALKKIVVKHRGESRSVDSSSHDHEQVSTYLNEIELLLKLRNKAHCIQMLDYEVSQIQHDATAQQREGQRETRILMLFECGEIDLAHLLRRQPNACFADVFYLKSMWRQMLLAVHTIHALKIVHGDLKPANFLLVQGALKLIDFGIAKQIASNETTHIARDSQIGTLNYICPEALVATSPSNSSNSAETAENCYKLGRAADVWSLGCILHQMCFGCTPFTHLPFAAKLTAIVSASCKQYIKTHPEKYINEATHKCLLRTPKKRITIKQLLRHPMLDAVHAFNCAFDSSSSSSSACLNNPH